MPDADADADDDADGQCRCHPRGPGPRRASMSRRLSLTFDLPPGGDYLYLDLELQVPRSTSSPADAHANANANANANATSPALGVMFFRASDLIGVLLSPRDGEMVEALGGRPVAGYCFDGSAAAAAGMREGMVLCSVGGVDVVDYRRTTDAVREAQAQAQRQRQDEGKGTPSPMRLLVYCPQWSIVKVHEGTVLVKLEKGPSVTATETETPKLDEGTSTGGATAAAAAAAAAAAISSVQDWDERFVVIGGVLGKHRKEMHLFRSKAEHDTAVVDAKCGRPTAVEHDTFSLFGAEIVAGEERLREAQVPVPLGVPTCARSSSTSKTASAAPKATTEGFYYLILREGEPSLRTIKVGCRESTKAQLQSVHGGIVLDLWEQTCATSAPEGGPRAEDHDRDQDYSYDQGQPAARRGSFYDDFNDDSSVDIEFDTLVCGRGGGAPGRGR